MICCGLPEGGLVKLKFIIVIVALLTPGTAAKPPAQSSETPADRQIEAVFSAVTSPDAPGLAVLVRKNGKAVFERGYGVRDLHSKAKIDAHSKPAEPHFRIAGLRRLDGRGGKSEGNDLDAGKTNSRRRSFGIVEKRKKRKIRAGDKLVVQQFRLRRVGNCYRQGFRKILRRISSRSNLCAAKNESHHRLSKRKKRSRESRVRPPKRKRRAQRTGTERNFRDARRWRRVFESRRSRQVGRRAAQSHFAERKRISSCVNAGETRRRLRAPLAQGTQRRQFASRQTRCLRLWLAPRSVSRTPADVAHGKHDGLPHRDRTIHRQQRLDCNYSVQSHRPGTGEAGAASCRSNFQRAKSSPLKRRRYKFMTSRRVCRGLSFWCGRQGRRTASSWCAFAGIA